MLPKKEITMNYLNIYNNLIQKRSIHKLVKTGNGSIESHHIIPRCMSGSDDESNIINLTCREHWIAHMLLWKIYQGTQFEEKLCLAWSNMRINSNETKRIINNSRTYQILRKEFSKWNTKTKSKYITWNGETHTIKEWSVIRNIPYNQFRMFFYRGYSIDKIMTKCVIEKRTHEYNGKMYTTKELSKLLNISYHILKKGFQKGRTINEIITHKPRYRYQK